MKHLSANLEKLVASAMEAANDAVAGSQDQASRRPWEAESSGAHMEAELPEDSPKSPQKAEALASQGSGRPQAHKWAASPILSETQVEHLSDADLRALFKNGSAEIPGFDHKNEYQFCKGHTLANPWNSNEGGGYPLASLISV